MKCKERKCPCRLWNGCHEYVDIYEQERRLKNKEYNHNEWYDNSFREELKMGDLFISG